MLNEDGKRMFTLKKTGKKKKLKKKKDIYL